MTIERQSQTTYDVVLRVRGESVTQLRSFFEATVEREGDGVTTLCIRFPSRELAIVHVLVHGDAVEIVSPGDLPAAIVERAKSAIETFTALAPARPDMQSGHLTVPGGVVFETSGQL